MPRARSLHKAGANLSAAVQVGTTAADTFKTTIGALRADLEIHRHRIVVIETLIAGLEFMALPAKILIAISAVQEDRPPMQAMNCDSVRRGTCVRGARVRCRRRRRQEQGSGAAKLLRSPTRRRSSHMLKRI